VCGSSIGGSDEVVTTFLFGIASTIAITMATIRMIQKIRAGFTLDAIEAVCWSDSVVGWIGFIATVSGAGEAGKAVAPTGALGAVPADTVATRLPPNIPWIVIK